LLCSATWVRGQAAADLYNKGVSYLQNEQYLDAAKTFDTIIQGYPTTANIDDIRISAGFAYLHAGKYPEAVDRLAKQAADKSKPDYQATALYFTALAQFSLGQDDAKNDKAKGTADFTQTVKTLTDLINLINTAPTAENKAYLEQAIYYRALSQYLREDYTDSEKDLQMVIQQFASTSLLLPDYYLQLGSDYAVETNQAVQAKKPDAQVRAMADKALAAFDHVSNDPNALVQANQANMNKAEILFMLAQLDPSNTQGYQTALDAYRKVRRKDDMVPLQKAHLDEMRTKVQDAARASVGLNFMSNSLTLILSREEGRLADLQKDDDPIIQALIRMAECYVSMRQPDEARTILHRLSKVKLTADQQQEVDFQTLYSYVLGGQTGQADKALTDYLSKHAGDPNADSLSLQIAGKLMERKDYQGALTQALRGLHDFPKGRYVADLIGIQAQALTRLGRIKESQDVVDGFLKNNPTSPKAFTLILSRAQNKTSQGDLTGALEDYKTVKDNAAAGAEMQSSADAGYIQTLSTLARYDDVIAEAKAFEAKNPTSPALPNVMLFAAMALDHKHDPGAVAAMQEIAQKFPKNDVAPFALFYVVNIYQRGNNVPAMVQAANDLSKAYPEAYNFILQAADAVSASLLKAKKFDDAVALYQPLANAPKADVASTAQNKIGAVLIAAAKSMGAYQSMSPDVRKDADARLGSAEQAYELTLKKFPDQLSAVGDAFEGLVTATQRRRSWGEIKDADMEGALGKLAGDLNTPEMQARFELAKAGLVFVQKDASKRYGEALDRFKKVIAANPGLELTRQETNHFGELLLAAKDYPTALKVYSDLLDHAAETDTPALGDAYYGIGATELAQGNVAEAKKSFMKLESLPGKGRWHPHISDADYGIALADEESGSPADIDEAKQIYNGLMTNPAGGAALQAKAMIGFGRILEKAGYALKPQAGAGPNEYGVHYYQEPHILYGIAVPALSAEGLFDAGQAYDKAGDKVNAKAQYDLLLKNYGTTAPDWAAKAQAAGGTLSAAAPTAPPVAGQ
jgi:tetratricopeptide (TPR) repeat protein